MKVRVSNSEYMGGYTIELPDDYVPPGEQKLPIYKPPKHHNEDYDREQNEIRMKDEMKEHDHQRVWNATRNTR